MNKILFWFIIFLLVSIPTLFLIPKLDKSFFPESKFPGAITVFGIGIIFTLLTLMLFYLFYKEKNLSKGFLISAFAYSTLIIITRFILSPLSLYNSNASISYGFSTNFVNPISFLFIAIGIFLLYFLSFLILYFIFKRKAKKAIENKQEPKKSWIFNLLKIFGFILLLGGVIIISALPLMVILFVSPIGNSIPYLFYVFSTVFGILMTLCLIGIILFVCIAFNSVTEQAIKMRDIGILTGFFWIGASILFLFSALWFIYLLILIALWPLKTFVPGGYK